MAATRALDERAGFTLEVEDVDDVKSGDSTSETVEDPATPAAAEASGGQPLAPKARRAWRCSASPAGPSRSWHRSKPSFNPIRRPCRWRISPCRWGSDPPGMLAEPEQTREWSEPDVLGLVLPPLEHSPVLHVPKRSPSVLIRAGSGKQLWLRLANRYEIEANDLDGERTLAETAAWLRDQTDRMLADLSLDSRMRDADRPSAVSAFPPSDPPSAALSREKPARRKSPCDCGTTTPCLLGK